jgi:queuosine precursor transporter
MKEHLREVFRNEKPDKKEVLFIFLTGVFLGALVLTNLIAGKFFYINILGVHQPLSAGIIAYPVTFLITDVISEIYGHRRANMVVFAGLAVSVFAVFILMIAGAVPVWENSPVSQENFNAVFGITPGIIFGSMTAYLFAQFLDVRLFEFWRKLTQGKHLWLRNNGSTIISQLVDTTLVVIIALVVFPTLDGNSATEPISLQLAFSIIIGQYIFKAFIAAADTPFIYMAVHYIHRWLESDNN